MTVNNAHRYFDEMVGEKKQSLIRHSISKIVKAVHTKLPQVEYNNTRGYQKVRALMLQLFNGIRYHTKDLSCVKLIYV